MAMPSLRPARLLLLLILLLPLLPLLPLLRWGGLRVQSCETIRRLWRSPPPAALLLTPSTRLLRLLRLLSRRAPLPGLPHLPLLLRLPHPLLRLCLP